MSGSHSRNKGQRFERWVANQLREIGIDARRNVSESQTGNAGDIKIECNAPLVIQCKHYAKRPPIQAAVREAREVADPIGFYAIAITKADNEEPVAHMPASDLFDMLRALHACGAW